MALDLAIQVVNYDTKRHLVECLDSVLGDLAGPRPTFSISVLDNDSGDDLSDVAGRYGAAVSFDRAERNLGYGGGHNRLARGGSSRHLLFLNPDVKIIEPATIQRLWRRIEAAAAVEGIGPKLVGADGRPQAFDHGELHGWRAAVAIGAGHSRWEERERSAEVAWVSGAMLMVDRGAFDRVGGFDERFFLYKEEEDLCLRIRASGGQVLYEPGVRVMHHRSVVADPDVHRPAAVEQFIQKHYDQPVRRRAFGALHRVVRYL